MNASKLTFERLKPEGGADSADYERVNELISGFNITTELLTLPTLERIIKHNDLFVARLSTDGLEQGRIIGMVLLSRKPTLSSGKSGEVGEVIIDPHGDYEEAQEMIREKLLALAVKHAQRRGFKKLEFAHLGIRAQSILRQLYEQKYPWMSLTNRPLWYMNLVPNGTHAKGGIGVPE